MKIPFPFEVLLIFSIMSCALLFGFILRGSLKFLQVFLFPSCLIGGLVGFILISTGIISVDISLLESFAFHLFNISFISVGLTSGSDEAAAASKSKEMAKGAIWMALIQAITFPMQAIAGGLLVLFFNGIGIDLFKTFGFLVPLGFIQGPGQALSIGKVWEEVGFQHAATIGLTFAAVGFLFAFFVGVPLVNRGIRKGQAAHTPARLSEDILKGFVRKNQERESAGELTTHSGNVDTLAFQMSLIGVIYLLSYTLVNGLGGMLPPKLGTTLWGFFFFIGLALAILVKVVIKKLGYSHLINPGVQKRITGLAVDYMIVATVMAVQLVIVWQYIIPITVMSVVSGFLTTLAVVYFGNRLWGFNLERTAAIYGTVTGTVSTGLLLLRIVDPEFKTSAALELGFMIMFVSPVIIGCMLLVSAPVVWEWSINFTMIIFAILMIVSIAVMKLSGLWGRKRV